MGVPNTTTFTLQNVVDVVDPTTNDLVDSFADAVASKFDSTYEGSKNQLLNFRNYDAGLPSFLGSVTGRNPCSLTMNVTYYHNGSGTNPAVGDTVYTDAIGFTPYTQDNMRGNFGFGGTAIVFSSNNGVISSMDDCTPP
tara:strand:+ start:43 stop:459 length:417 start_codon:yes stop_codon:yes gene_type:complete